MARLNRADRAFNQRLDDLENQINHLKRLYDNYFNGIERFEPIKERDDLHRTFRDMMQETINSTAQRFRFQTLRARMSTIDLYITRNLVQIERGTHPKFNFRAKLHERARGLGEAPPTLTEEERRRLREDAAFRQIYDRYMEARRSCGQSADLDFDNVQKTLRAQVRQIKATYRCDSVKFRVVVEAGQAKLKAVPQNAAGSPPPERSA